MKIKKGDTVIVIAGKDKGKTSSVARVIPRENRVLVEGVNMKKKHQRPQRSGAKGQTLEKALPIHVSNVMLVDPKTNERTRIGKKFIGGTWSRVAQKSGTVL